jgi:DNA-binding MarR family transcriptional regulator
MELNPHAGLQPAFEAQPAVKLEKPDSHRSLERGLQALELIAKHPALNLAQLAAAMKMHRSTLHHMLQALVRAGYLAQQEDRYHTYILTSKLPEALKGPKQ